jgi:hypothetical protein
MDDSKFKGPVKTFKLHIQKLKLGKFIYKGQNILGTERKVQIKEEFGLKK